MSARRSASSVMAGVWKSQRDPASVARAGVLDEAVEGAADRVVDDLGREPVDAGVVGAESEADEDVVVVRQLRDVMPLGVVDHRGDAVAVGIGRESGRLEVVDCAEPVGRPRSDRPVAASLALGGVVRRNEVEGASDERDEGSRQDRRVVGLASPGQLANRAQAAVSATVGRTE